MNEEKIQDLLKYLTSIGFEGSLLEQTLRENIKNGVEQFKAQHKLLWENEEMQFSLQLSKDLQFHAYRLVSYTATYVEDDKYLNHQTFIPTPDGICNANLAFYIVSNRFDDLLEKISPLNLEEFPGVVPYRSLEIFLSRNATDFTLKYNRNEPEGYIEYEIPISKIEGWYTIDTYTVTLTPYPNITHGNYCGINTKELENEMKRVNWRNDQELFVLRDNSEPEILPPAINILEAMLKLTDDPKGCLVADKLMLKYWSDASYFDSFIQQRAWDYSNTIPTRKQHFPVALEAKAAFNLLCGRAILQHRVNPLPHNKPAWVRFDFTTKSPNGGYLTEIMPEFTEDNLEYILSTLPITEEMQQQIFRGLARGDIGEFLLPDGKKLLLEANPEQKTINIYSEEMRFIQVNFGFDPDWKPTQIPESKSEELKRKSRQNIILPDHPPDKGRRFGRKR